MDSNSETYTIAMNSEQHIAEVKFLGDKYRNIAETITAPYLTGVLFTIEIIRIIL